MLKFVISLAFIFAVVGVLGQSDDYSDSDPINNRLPIKSPQKSSCAFPCPRGWSYFSTEGICLFVTPKLPWNAAEQFCVKLGANLMSVHGKKSFEIAHQMMDDNEIWVGLNKINNEDVWKHTNNAIVNYLPWNTGPSSKCARIVRNGLQQEHSCETEHLGICQIYASA